MLSSRAIRTWSWLHTYSSLVCTAFMLLLCLTGLPLIFQHEIAHWTGDVAELPIIQYSGKPASLDAILAAARARYPERIVQYASADEEQPLLWYVTLTPTPAATTNYKSIAVDGRTALVLHDFPTNQGFMYWMFRLHVDLFAGLPGMLFLGCMGLLLVIAIVSGLVLYSPFMRKLEFGEVRRKRSKNIKWLDLHNLLGIVTLVWALAVASTGVVNATADLLVGYWQHTHISNLLKPYKSQPVVLESERAPMQAILKAANSAKPGMQLVFAAFPGTDFSSPHHVTVYLRGTTPLTAKLFQPVLVDARSAQVTATPKLPWYLKAMLLSQPLHFGDYGGMPMKILWTLLDIATIIVLGSGLYLWWQRRKHIKAEPKLSGRAQEGNIPR